MPFKLVQTREKSRILLSIVPQRWEVNNKLKWPNNGQVKKSEFNRMLRDENSSPGKNWMEINCRVKRECSTYAEALTLSKEMSDKSDTDASDAMPPPQLPPKRKTGGSFHSPATDFNDVVSMNMNMCIIV